MRTMTAITSCWMKRTKQDGPQQALMCAQLQSYRVCASTNPPAHPSTAPQSHPPTHTFVHPSPASHPCVPRLTPPTCWDPGSGVLIGPLPPPLGLKSNPAWRPSSPDAEHGVRGGRGVHYEADPRRHQHPGETLRGNRFFNLVTPQKK